MSDTLAICFPSIYKGTAGSELSLQIPFTDIPATWFSRREDLLELNTVKFTDIPCIKKHQFLPKRRYQPTKPQGISSQKTAILVQVILYSYI